MTSTNGTTNDKMNTNESAEFSDEPPEAPSDATRPTSSSSRYRRSVSGLDRNARATGMSDPSLRRSSKNKSRQRIRRYRIALAVLIIVLVVMSGISTLSWNRWHVLKTEVFELGTQLHTASADLDEARDLIAAQEAELRAMRTGQLPGLTPLELDTQVDVDDGYLYKLTFMESGVADQKQLEYHAILRNTGATPVVPQVKIILLDSKGLQTGTALIGDSNLDSDGNAPALKPGETRSYMSVLATEPDTESAYFLVEVD